MWSSTPLTLSGCPPFLSCPVLTHTSLPPLLPPLSHTCHSQPHPQQTLYLIRTKEVEYPPYLSRDAVDFMRSALMREPTMRPTIPELLQHAWIKRYARRPQPSPTYVRRNSVPLSLATQATTWSMPGNSKV